MQIRVTTVTDERLKNEYQMEVSKPTAPEQSTP